MHNEDYENMKIPVSFENDYKKMMEENLPDKNAMWERIMAGIDEETTINRENKENIVPIESAKKKKRITNKMIYAFSSVAVAAICIGIIVPAFLINKSSESNMSAPAYESDSLAEDMGAAEETVCYEAENSKDDDYNTRDYVASESCETACDSVETNDSTVQGVMPEEEAMCSDDIMESDYEEDYESEDESVSDNSVSENSVSNDEPDKKTKEK